MIYIFKTEDSSEAEIIMHANELYAQLLEIDTRIRRFQKDHDIEDETLETFLMDLYASLGWVRDL